MNKLLIIAVIILQHVNGIFPEIYSSSHFIGMPVLLECGSLIKVNCSWQHNGRTINIAKRYRYLFSNGSVTVDCSIDIGYFHEDDVGNWTCWSLSNDQFDGDLLASYSLTAKPKQHTNFRDTSPVNLSTQIGAFVTIPCKFNLYLPECHWLRNDKPVVIVNRYKFVHFAVLMNDCSINITSVQNVDFGTWHCALSTNNARGYFASRIVHLTESDEDSYITEFPAVERNNTIVEHPQNSTAYINDTLILRCRFRDSARCVWLRNEQAIHVGNRHRYLIDNNNSGNRTDCSLMISNIQTVDKGQWRCLNAGDDLHLSTSSEEAFVSVINDDKASAIIKRPTDVIVPFGDNVALTCLFDHPVNCDWSREGMSVMINGRYSYSSAENGVLTTDCSIQILAVNDMDVGDWSCANKLNFANSHFQNAQSSLSLLKTPSPVKILLNNRELTGFFVQLQDTPALASMEVACVSEQGNPPSGLSWHMNEPTEIPANYEVEMVDNHRYTTKLRSNVTSLPRGRIVELSCIGDFPNITDVTSFMLFIGDSEVKGLALLESPVSITLRLEKSYKMKLGCTFNKPVQCNWRLNGGQIPLEKYTYDDGSNGINTSDCTIAIRTTSEMMGRYRCYSHDTDNHQEISSSEALITFMSQPSLPWIVSSSYDHHHIENSTIFVYSNLLPLHIFCESHRGNPTPILHWELDGRSIDNNSSSTFTSSIKNDSERNLKGQQISVVIPRILLVKNATSLKCVLDHPSYPRPIYDQVILLRNKKPVNPIMVVNATLVRNDVTVLTNTSTHIHCVSQAGYPAAKMHWELDGQTISGTSEILSIGNNLSTVILPWPIDFNWTTFSQSLVSLKCVAEHPEYDQPIIAKAVVKFFVANKPKVIHLMNTDTIMKAGSHFDFICQSSEAMSCGMKLNNVSVEDLPFSPSSIKEHTCKVVLPRFKKDDVGLWQCTCLLSADNTTVDSNPIYLSLLSAPSGPEIRQGDKVITEIMLKTPDEIPDFKCVVEGANPAAYLLWSNKDNLVDSDSGVIRWKNHTYTTIIQWKNIIFKPQLNNMVYLYCLARHPAYDVLEKRAEVAVTFPLAPRNPRILFNESEVNNEPLIIATNDLQYIRCLCEQGNPVATLTWQVNYCPIKSTFKENIITLGIRTAELRWNPAHNQYLEGGPVLLTCTASHPKFSKNRQASLRIILQNPEAFSSIKKSASKSNAAWVGIVLSTFLLLLGIVAVFLYVRYHRRYSGDESGNVVSRIQGQLSAFLGGLMHKSEEPFILFSNSDEETTISRVGSK